MKKRIAIGLVLLWLLLMPTVALAAEEYTVGADDVTAQPGETVLLPLSLTGNQGIMGFRLTVRYPDSQLTLTEVSPGSVTASGLFNTTITAYESVKGEFDILWSNSEAVTTDGTVAMLGFRIQPTAVNGDYSISITYSQEDTFDGDYADVALQCQPVTVTVNDGTAPESTPASEEPSDAEDTQPTTSGDIVTVADEYLIASVQEALASFGKPTLADLDKNEQAAALEHVNNRLVSYDANAAPYESFAALTAAYDSAVQRVAVQKVLDSADDVVIQQAKDEVLQAYGVSSFRELPADIKQEAVKQMLQKLTNSGADTQGFDSITDEAIVAAALDEIIQQSAERQSDGIDVDKTVTNKGSKEGAGRNIAVIIGACLALGALLTIVVIWKTKRRNKDEKAE